MGNLNISGKDPPEYSFEFEYQYGSGETIEKFAKKNISDIMK